MLQLSGATPATSNGRLTFPDAVIRRRSSGETGSFSLPQSHWQTRRHAAERRRSRIIAIRESAGTGRCRTTARPRAGRRYRTQAEHKFEVLCLDRKTGKLLWQRTAKVAAPHEGYHRAYGSFASNSPVTDGKYVYASFGSRGIYCYDFNGKLIWEKDLGVQMRMRLAFGEGTAPLLIGDRLFLVFDHEAGSFIVSLDKRTGKELWRVPRDERSSWSTPLAVEHAGRKQIVVTGTTKSAQLRS